MSSHALREQSQLRTTAFSDREFYVSAELYLSAKVAATLRKVGHGLVSITRPQSDQHALRSSAYRLVQEKPRQTGQNERPIKEYPRVH